MMGPDWKYIETIQKKIRIIRVNNKERYIDASDLESGVSISLNCNEKIDLKKIKKAKIYTATVKVFSAEITPEFEGQLIEAAMNDLDRLKAIEAMRASGFKPSKYELISLTH